MQPHIACLTGETMRERVTDADAEGTNVDLTSISQKEANYF